MIVAMTFNFICMCLMGAVNCEVLTCIWYNAEVAVVICTSFPGVEIHNKPKQSLQIFSTSLIPHETYQALDF